MRDLVIIGAGPAGLSAAITGASEGLDVLLIESNEHVGGQAWCCPSVENYPGAVGLCGRELTTRMLEQARALGAEVATGVKVEQVVTNYTDGSGRGLPIWWVDGAEAYAVILATGAVPRRLGVPGDEFVTYGARPTDIDVYKGDRVAIIGGGNAAGQAVCALAAKGATVHLYTRRPLEETMSAFLIDRVREAATIIMEEAEVRSVGPRGVQLRLWGETTVTRRFDDVLAYVGVDRVSLPIDADAPGQWYAGGDRISVAVGRGALTAQLAVRHVSKFSVDNVNALCV